VEQRHVMSARQSGVLEVGKIAKAHGLRGEVIVELFTNRQERVAKGAELVSGDRTFAVERSQPHQHRWIVKFKGVESREDAEAIHGLVLSAEPIEDPDALWVHEMLDSEVVDAQGVGRGTITNIVANPAGDLIETSHGHLIPLRFVTANENKKVTVDPPEGLFDLL
jgi:16S rRNA processing protein RimM